MDIMLQRIIHLIGPKHGATKELADAIGVSPNLVTDWKGGRAKSYTKYAPKIAEHYGVSLDWLSGLSDIKEKPLTVGEELSDMTLIRFPVIGTISAGNGCIALEEYTGDYTFFASSDLCAEPEEYFVLRIKGDSMYPKLLEDDHVLVRRRQCVESGRIAVVIFNGEEATVKKIQYENDKKWVDLIPINPMYQTKRIIGIDLEEFRFLGEVVKLQRDI